MKRLYYSLALFLVATTLMRCNVHEVTPREYPRMRTLDVTNISSSGATFTGDVIHAGNEDIVEYGFSWTDNDSTVNRVFETKIITGPFTTGTFSSEITSTLQKNITYYLRAFARTENYIVYGKKVSFVSLGSKGP